MCDTILAPPQSAAERIMLFGKNSDRQCNEAQTVERFVAAEHAPASRVACTYISIPQAAHTHEVLLCRPFWTWGAEMGANEHGVVIGNEGLHARTPAPEAEALLGMDLLRLALERAATAAEAVEVVTTLLERHGQGGNCGHVVPAYYNNGFVIADPREAFVLETIGREWLLERVGGVRALSNEYSITSGVERSSAGLREMLRALGCSDDGVTNYAEAIRDPQRVHIGSARGRRARATSLLESNNEHLRIFDIIRILRDHDPAGRQANDWDPKRVHTYSLCIHAGADERVAQTTGAMASELRCDDSVHWVTGTAAPCISIFKPVLMGVALPAHGPLPTEQYDPSALWWRHERLHRAAVLGDFPSFLEQVRQERDGLESGFHARVTAVLNGGGATDRAHLIAECWREAAEAEERWHSLLRAGARRESGTHEATWARMNELASLDLNDR